MRFNELNLIAYGKFTDHRLLFPKATHDFHVIVGPNEAGKSTVRRAITELLFGMATRSPLGFKHPQSDLRMSGSLEAATGGVAFMRTKQQKSLRSMSGEQLPDNYLNAILGSLTEETFEQLYCLDHERLLKGGQGIVDPRNSVSQILFQAASGLEGFAEVREALAARASELFGKKGRSNEYMKASDRYMGAQKELKEVLVRTKEWVEARDALKAADDALEAERKKKRDLELQRSVWERSRRLGPLVNKLGELQNELAEVGDTIVFPTGAKETLDSGISAMNAAEAIVRTRQADVVEREQQLSGINVDGKILERAAEIERLVKLCSLYANHPSHLPLRRNEVEQWIAEVLAESAPFDWGNTEEEVRTRLPQEKVLRAIDTLLKERGALVADLRAAKDNEAERQTTVDDLQDKLDASSETAIDPQLAQALAQALPYKASDGKQKVLQSAVNSADQTAKHAMAALGRPGFTEELLRSMPLPSTERVSTYRVSRQAIVKAADVARSLVNQHEGDSAGLQLQISQFIRAHKVTTVGEVSDARRARDEQWGAIKTGSATVEGAAPQLDVAIRLADELVDSHTLSETDGASLQGLRDRFEKATEEHGRQNATLQDRENELIEFDAQWAAQASKMGLDGMELDDLPEWLTRREAALKALGTLAEKRRDYETECDAATQAREGLSRALSAARIQTKETDGLTALCTTAEEHNKAIERARIQRQGIQQQLQTAQTALKAAQTSEASKTTAVNQWGMKWKEALARAHLAGVGEDIAEVEAAVNAAGGMRQRLEKVTSHRTERIEAMEADLEQLKEASEALVQALMPELAQNSPDEVSRILSSALEEAKLQSGRRAEAQKFLDLSKRQLSEANSTMGQAKHGLEPLLKIADVDDPALALPLAEKSQRKATLVDSIAQAKAELDRGSDGLSLDQVQAEIGEHPVTDAQAQLMLLKDGLEDSDRQLTELTQARLTAKQAFDVIAGGDKAALAEAQRQEAVADMSEAGEEYLKLATASALLKWAVDRYRDRKQGPLLQRASAVFKNLTLGFFEKLRVDYEQTPPALLAYRPNNQAVPVSGLSDGTRDQLFLALRIAALELQTEQGTLVPFVADDLFINFDDKRSQAGLQALHALSVKAQVLFLSHHEHLLPLVQRLFPNVNVISLTAEGAPA